MEISKSCQKLPNLLEIPKVQKKGDKDNHFQQFRSFQNLQQFQDFQNKICHIRQSRSLALGGGFWKFWVAHPLTDRAWGRTPPFPFPTTVCHGGVSIYIYIYIYTHTYNFVRHMCESCSMYACSCACSPACVFACLAFSFTHLEAQSCVGFMPYLPSSSLLCLFRRVVHLCTCSHKQVEICESLSVRLWARRASQPKR